MRRSAASRTITVAFGVVALVIVAAAGFLFLTGQPTRSSSTPGTLNPNPGGSSTTCVILGQPGGIAVRVLSDSAMKPLTGALVVANNTPATCNGEPATTATSESFTTNGTEWTSLPSDGDSQYHFRVTYAGQDHNFTATLMPVSLTCATISLPSGKTNVTITEFGESCTAVQG